MRVVLCPAAPTVSGDLDVSLAELKPGSELIRFHSPAYAGNAFNPNTGRKMEDAAAGARFSLRLASLSRQWLRY